MSRDILGEELADEGEHKEREHYEPAEELDCSELVDYLVGLYVNGTLSLDDSMFREKRKESFDHAAEMARQFLKDKSFEPQGFLDALVDEVLAADGYEFAKPRRVLDPVVQALYELGHNALTVDTSRDSREFYIGGDLHGTEDDTLAVTYVGRFHSVGAFAEHSNILCIGDTSYGGKWAKHCEMHFTNGKSPSVGSSSTDSTYYITDQSNIAIDLDPMVQGPAVRCTYYVDAQLEPHTLEFYHFHDFFEYGNKLYWKGEDDEWIGGDWDAVEPFSST